MTRLRHLRMNYTWNIWSFIFKVELWFSWYHRCLSILLWFFLGSSYIIGRGCLRRSLLYIAALANEMITEEIKAYRFWRTSWNQPLIELNHLSHCYLWIHCCLVRTLVLVSDSLTRNFLSRLDTKSHQIFHLLSRFFPNFFPIINYKYHFFL